MSELKKRRYLVGGGHSHAGHSHTGHSHDGHDHSHEGHDHGNAARSESISGEEEEAESFLDSVPERDEITAAEPLSDEAKAALSAEGLALLPTGEEKASAQQVEDFIGFLRAQSGDTNSSVMWDASFESEAFEAQILPEVRKRFEAATDTLERLELWGILHIQDTLTDYQAIPFGEEVDKDPDASHRASQQWGMYFGRVAETDEELAAMRAQIEAGTASVADIDALAERKQEERRIENTYGVDLRNLPDDFAIGQERRVWSVTELEQVENAMKRMPVEHLKDNKNLQEIVRSDVRRDEIDGAWVEDLDTGADAGGGVITFYDTGVGEKNEETGEMAALEPWRLPRESALAGHDAANPTTLVEEVLSHEVGHTVHQGDDAHFQAFKDMNGWKELSTDQITERLLGLGMSATEVEEALESMNASRDEYYGDQHELNGLGGTDFQVDPYDEEGFIESNTHAVPESENWDYADSNASDHYAEMYTKAIHAPEELHTDLLDVPTERATAASQALAIAKEELALANASDDAGWREAAAAALTQAEADQEGTREAATLLRTQWDFFRTEVFKTDDTDIHALKPTGGNDAVLEEFQAEAAKAMTPQQLQSVRDRFADRI